ANDLFQVRASVGFRPDVPLIDLVGRVGVHEVVEVAVEPQQAALKLGKGHRLAAALGIDEGAAVGAERPFATSQARSASPHSRRVPYSVRNSRHSSRATVPARSRASTTYLIGPSRSSRRHRTSTLLNRSLVSGSATKPAASSIDATRSRKA